MTWGAKPANSKSKEYKKLKMQAKGMSMKKSKAASASDKELTGPQQPNCAWQVRLRVLACMHHGCGCWSCTGMA